MILEAIKYTRFKDEDSEWSIAGKNTDIPSDGILELENINLIVGKNASGKSKTINVIREIADLLAGEIKISSLKYYTAEYELLFTNNTDTYRYLLDFKNKIVKREMLYVNGEKKLDRENNQLFYKKENKFLSFKTDDNILSVSRRDSEQQPFFDALIDWGKSLTHYQFGSNLGKNMLLRDINLVSDIEAINLKNSNRVIEIFINGEKKYGKNFIKIIKQDMKTIGYTISKIEIKPTSLSGFGISVQEDDLNDITDQVEMSQGMFRALSLLIQLNYSLLSKYPSCILIDDIGEGLDYDRSKKLIEIIIEKVESSNVQVVMSSNDRFVMNNVPIEYWSVIQRIPKKSIFYNYKNSKAIFDDFKYTGLNNFDFFSTKFYIEGFQEV